MQFRNFVLSFFIIQNQTSNLSFVAVAGHTMQTKVYHVERTISLENVGELAINNSRVMLIARRLRVMSVFKWIV